MADFTVRQGDDFTIADTLKDADGNAVSIQGHSIVFSAIPLGGGAAVIDAADASNDQTGDGSDGSKGKVSFVGSGVQAATPGYWLAWWRDTTGKLTYPNGGYLLVEVTAKAPVDAAAVRLADSSDFEDRIGLSLNADEHVRANDLLERVTAQIQSAARQKIIQATDDVYTRNGTNDRRILLPERPVQSVASVTLDGTELVEGSDWFLDGNELVRKVFTFLSAAALDAWTFGRGFGYEWQTLEVTYTHGYAAADIPGFLKEICCEAVARVWFNPAAVIQQDIADTRTTFAPYAEPPRGLRLTRDETAEIRRFFGVTGGSIPFKE